MPPLRSYLVRFAVACVLALPLGVVPAVAELDELGPNPSALPVGAVPAATEVPDYLRAPLTKHGHALLIGVDQYDRNNWRPLPVVRQDLRDLKAALDPHFETVDILTNPTADEIHTKLHEFMLGKYSRPDERLLIYYSGHGFSDQNPTTYEYTGYITGRDTPACNDADCSPAIFGGAVGFREIEDLNKSTHAGQVLNLFDSCFSGLALTKSSDPDPKHYDEERAFDAIKKPIRYFITAGGAGETIPADSPFAPLIIRALKGEADIWHDGFFSDEELGSYIQHKFPAWAHGDYHPQKGPIDDIRLAAGKFMLLTALGSTDLVAAPFKVSPHPPTYDWSNLDILYWDRPQDQGRALRALSSLGINFRKKNGNYPSPTDLVSCTSDVPLEAVRTLALALFDAGVPLRSIKTNDSPGEKMKIIIESVELDSTPGYPLLSREQIERMTSCSLNPITWWYRVPGK